MASCSINQTRVLTKCQRTSMKSVTGAQGAPLATLRRTAPPQTMLATKVDWRREQEGPTGDEAPQRDNNGGSGRGTRSHCHGVATCTLTNEERERVVMKLQAFHTRRFVRSVGKKCTLRHALTAAACHRGNMTAGSAALTRRNQQSLRGPSGLSRTT
jgi:hypothetical protein